MTDLNEFKVAFDAFNGAATARLARQDARLDRIETTLKRPGLDAGPGVKTLSAEAKALRVWARSGDDAELKALSVGSDPEGGYLVPTEMSDHIIRKVFETSPLRKVARVMTTRSDAIEMLLDKDEAGAEWVGESATRSETTAPQFAEVRITAHELHAQVKATQKLLDDADISVEDWLAEKVADKFRRTESTAFISGNGVSKPRGLLDYPTATTTDSTRAWGTVQYVASGSTSGFPTLTGGADDAAPLFDLIYSLKAAYRQEAVWLMNKATVNVVRKMRDDTDQFLWTPGLEAGQPDRLLGYSIIEAEDMPDVASDSFSIAFGNFGAAYTILDRIGQRVLRDPFTAKPFVLFDFTRRIGGAVVNSEAYKLMKFATS